MKFSFLLTLTVFSNFCAFSCSCAFKNNVENEIKKRDLVILGKVKSIDFHKTEENAYFEIKVLIVNNFKSDKNLSQTVTLRTSQPLPSCGFKFKRGKKYLIYADVINDSYFTSQCTRTTSKWKDEVKTINSLPNTT